MLNYQRVILLILVNHRHRSGDALVPLVPGHQNHHFQSAEVEGHEARLLHRHLVLRHEM